MGLSWTPRRVGELYCSPGCGGGCTWEAYERATDHASLLALRLGDGWEPRVWENLGWHWSAQLPNPDGSINNRAEVRESSSGGFVAYVGPGAYHADTPQLAVKEGLAVLRARRDELDSAVKRLEEAMV